MSGRCLLAVVRCHKQPVRSVALSIRLNLKRVVRTTDGNKTTIEAVYVPLSEQHKAVKRASSESHSTDCPLCRLNLSNLSYTDVRILAQFLDSRYELYPRHVTGLCRQKQATVRRLVFMAKMAGIIPDLTDHGKQPHWADTPPEYIGQGIKYYYKWSKWNIYYTRHTEVDQSIHTEAHQRTVYHPGKIYAVGPYPSKIPDEDAK